MSEEILLDEKPVQTDRINFLFHKGITWKNESHRQNRLKKLLAAKSLITDSTVPGNSSSSNNAQEYSLPTLLVLNGFSFLMRNLLMRNPDLRSPDKTYGATTLQWAVYKGNPVIVRDLLNHIKNNPDLADLLDAPGKEDVTPLMGAASYGFLDVVKLLLEAGASLKVTDRNGRTALDYANGKTEIVTFLKEFQALESQAKSSSSPTQDSKETPKIKLLTPQKALLRFGKVNPESTVTTQQKWQEEQEALYRQKITAEELIAAIKDGDNSALKQIFGAAQKAKDTIRDGKTEAIVAAATKTLKEFENIINHVNGLDRTPWFYAVQEDNAEAMVLLIQYGADVNRPNKASDTVLQWAAYENNAEAIETLFSPIIQTQLKAKGVKLEIDKQSTLGNTALAVAASYGQLDATIALLAAGANHQIPNNRKQTPLAIAEEASDDKSLQEKRAKTAACLRQFQEEQTKEFIPKLSLEIATPLYDRAAELVREMPEVDPFTPTDLILQYLGNEYSDHSGSGFIPTSFLNRVNEERSQKLLALIRPTDITQQTEKYGEDRWENIREVKKHIERGVRLDLSDVNGGNVLIYLVLNGYLSLTRKVLETFPGLISFQDTQFKRNALHWAAYEGNPAIMRVLLETLQKTGQLALINTLSGDGITPLMEAISLENLEAAKLLIALGADFRKIKSNGSSAYEMAKGETELLQFMQDFEKADDAKKTRLLTNQQRVLIHGMFTDEIPEQAAYLFEEKSTKQRFEEQCRERKSQELANALKDGDMEEVARLTATPKSAAKDRETKESAPPIPALGFDPNYEDHNGLSLLHYAAIAGDNRLVLKLLEHITDINAVDNKGNTALHLAVLHDRPTVIETLLTAGASLAIKNHKDQTPLALAKAPEHPRPRAAYCIEHFKKPKKRGPTLTTTEKLELEKINAQFEIMASTFALLDAAAAGDEKTVRDIFSKDTSGFEKLDDNGYTPLHLAAKNGHTNVVNVLLEHKTDIEAKGTDGFTPLACAAASGRLDVTEKLIRQGADIDAKDAKNKTLAELATGPVKKLYEDETRVILLRSRYLADQLALTEDARLTHHPELKNDQFTSLVLKKLASANESKKSKVIAGLIKDLKDEKPKSIKETLARLYGFSAAFGEKDSVAATMAESIAASRTEPPKPEESFLAGVARVFKGGPATAKPPEKGAAPLSTSKASTITTKGIIN